MARNVIMPYMGLTTVEGTVVRWLKREGDEVKKDEPLVEVLTDKVNTQVEAPESGILLKIVAPEGTVVPVTSTLCWIGQPGEKVPEDGQPAAEAAVAAAAVAEQPAPAAAAPDETYVKASPVAKRLAREHGVDLARITGTGPGGRIVEEDVLKFVRAQAQPAPAEEAIKASPLARNLAREMGVDLSTVTGTGPGGRITREDVEVAAEKRKAVAPPLAAEAAPRAAAPAMPSTPAPVASTVPLIGLRRTIAQRMAQSSQTVARVTHTTEVDMTEAVKMREQLVGESERLYGIRISYTDIIVKVVARALRQHPMMNARLVENEIQLLDQVNVGVAVAVPQGLVVPVVHNADQKDLIAIARESREKVERARAGTLTPDDIAGGTFTVTNLGAYEIDAFTPIVNLPEVGILGVGRIVEKPAVFQGEIAKRSMMFLSLSFDHRVVDGAPAAEFLRSVKQSLERPYTLLL